MLIINKDPAPTDRDYLKNADSEHLIGCSAQIWLMKSAYSAIQGFDWRLVSGVVCSVNSQLIPICQLKTVNSYRKKVFQSVSGILNKMGIARGLSLYFKIPAPNSTVIFE